LEEVPVEPVPPLTQAQTAPAPARPVPAVFEVRCFVVEGARLITREKIDAALALYIGADRTIDDLDEARRAGIAVRAARLRRRSRRSATRSSSSPATRSSTRDDAVRVQHQRQRPHLRRPLQLRSAASRERRPETLRVAYKANVSFRLDYGFILQKGTPTNSDSGRANFSLVWVF
jgi:hypothetical protein